jgi:hypothetical protein
MSQESMAQFGILYALSYLSGHLPRFLAQGQGFIRRNQFSQSGKDAPQDTPAAALFLRGTSLAQGGASLIWLGGIHGQQRLGFQQQ